MVAVDMLCLANSYKTNGRCVAGLRLDGGGWIRPISNRPNGELNVSEYAYSDGREAAVLDEVRVPLGAHKPMAHQPENWELVGRMQLLSRPPRPPTLRMMDGFLLRDRGIFGDASDSVGSETATESLALVKPENLKTYRKTRLGRSDQPRAKFVHKLDEYDLPITDPAWRQKVLDLPRGEHQASEIFGEREVLLTISLTEPLNGRCYKLVAALFAV